MKYRNIFNAAGICDEGGDDKLMLSHRLGESGVH